MMTLCEVHPSEIPAKAGRPKLASRSAFRTNSGRYSPSGSFPTMLIANERSIFTSAFAAERYWVGGTGPVKYLQEQIGQSPFHRAGNWSDDPSTTQAATGHSGAGNAHFDADSNIAVSTGIVRI